MVLLVTDQYQWPYRDSPTSSSYTLDIAACVGFIHFQYYFCTNEDFNSLPEVVTAVASDRHQYCIPFNSLQSWIGMDIKRLSHDAERSMVFARPPQGRYIWRDPSRIDTRRRQSSMQHNVWYFHTCLASCYVNSVLGVVECRGMVVRHVGHVPWDDHGVHMVTIGGLIMV